MKRYIVRKLVVAALTVIGVAVVVFLLVRVLPGDPASLRAGPFATEESIEQIRTQFGLDRPILVQFGDYLAGLARGDLGRSIASAQPVTDELLRRLPASIELAFYSLTVATVVGFALGIIAAATRGRWLDGVIRVFAVGGAAVAIFWLALLLIYLLYFRLGWFPPPVGRLPPEIARPQNVTGLYTVDSLLAGDLDAFKAALYRLALPVITLAFILSAPITNVVRSSMIKALESDYVRTARSIGVGTLEILFRDGLRNALPPALTTVGLVLGYMIGGNVVIELLFSWQGVGLYAYEAVRVSDIEALQGAVLMIGTLYVLINLAIDLGYGFIDPRIRFDRSAVSW